MKTSGGNDGEETATPLPSFVPPLQCRRSVAVFVVARRKRRLIGAPSSFSTHRHSLMTALFPWISCIEKMCVCVAQTVGGGEGPQKNDLISMSFDYSNFSNRVEERRQFGRRSPANLPPSVHTHLDEMPLSSVRRTDPLPSSVRLTDRASERGSRRFGGGCLYLLAGDFLYLLAATVLANEGYGRPGKDEGQRDAVGRKGRGTERWGRPNGACIALVCRGNGDSAGSLYLVAIRRQHPRGGKSVVNRR